MRRSITGGGSDELERGSGRLGRSAPGKSASALENRSSGRWRKETKGGDVVRGRRAARLASCSVRPEAARLSRPDFAQLQHRLSADPHLSTDEAIPPDLPLYSFFPLHLPLLFSPPTPHLRRRPKQVESLPSLNQTYVTHTHTQRKALEDFVVCVCVCVCH